MHQRDEEEEEEVMVEELEAISDIEQDEATHADNEDDGFFGSSRRPSY